MAALLRLIYIFLLKQLGTSEDFTSYIFVVSILAICSVCLGPIDGMVSRFSGKYRTNDLFGYLTFHLSLRCFVVIPVFVVCLVATPILQKMDVLYVCSLFMGLTGMILSNLIYIANIGRGNQRWLVNFVFVIPIFLKLVVLLFGYYLELTFRSIVVSAETSQFIICIIIAGIGLKNSWTPNSKFNLKEKAKYFFEEVKKYGIQGFILIPISYIKTNLAPALAATNLNADDTFLVVLVQRLMDQLKLILSRPNMLMSGLDGLSNKKNSDVMVWVVPGLLFVCIAVYFWFHGKSVPLMFFFIRAAELCIFLSSYRIFGNYLKLDKFSGNHRYILVPEFIFISALMLIDLSLANFAWLYLFRACLGFVALNQFSRRKELL